MNLRDLVSGSAHLCGPDTTLREAAMAMNERDHGSLAVVDGFDLVGLITERDLRREVAAGTDLDATPVSAVMGAEPDTFDPDLDVWDAAAWIAESDYRHLPVMDDESELLGVVSIRDLLKALVDSV
ncbi:MAG: CBS domain-containing protein [Acidimicrobiia bacterium]|nr:CBS domain-containing protein [Acidimicrobiia bacterium]MDH3462696.1 CBS domain-containing protein [Acidimicrobiia bacterium]